jgi:hypothetical protein
MSARPVGAPQRIPVMVDLDVSGCADLVAGGARIFVATRRSRWGRAVVVSAAIPRGTSRREAAGPRNPGGVGRRLPG